MGLSGGTSDAAVAYGQIVRSHKSMTGASSEAMCVGSRQRSGCRLPDVDYDPGLALALIKRPGNRAAPVRFQHDAQISS